MRVLFVNENIGGHATVHRHLEEAIIRDHPEIDADFFHVPAPLFLRRLVAAPVPGLARLDLDMQPLRSQLATSAVAGCGVRRRRATYDVLHIYTANAALLSVDALRSGPSVVSSDTTNSQNAFRLPHRHPTLWTPVLLPLTRFFERRVHAAATLLVAHSDWAAGSLAEYGVDSDRIRVVRFGVPIPPPLVRVATDPPEITFVGRQMDRKGGWRLVDLHQRHLRDHCVLNLVTPEPVPPLPGVRVHADITPGDVRLQQILARTSVFVFPSEIDQAPNAVLEAQAAGVPVVAYAVAAVPEMVQHGTTGLLVEPGDTEALVDAIEQLLADDGRQREMSAASRAWASTRFDVKASTTELVAVLREARSAVAVSGGGSRIGPSLVRRVGGIAGAARLMLGGTTRAGGGVVLAYHDVGVRAPAPTDFYVSPAALRSHLVAMKEWGYRFVGLGALTAAVARGERVDGMAAVVFDDGFVGVHEHALTVLGELGVPATVFVVTSALGATPWWWPGAGRTMTGSELAEAVGAGLTVAPHSRRHPSLVGLPDDDLGDEVGGAKAELEDRIGTAVDAFAYPFGHHDARVRAAVSAAGYQAAYTFLNGRVTTGLHPLKLPRMTMAAHHTVARLAYHVARSARSWPDHQVDTVVAGTPSG